MPPHPSCMALGKSLNLSSLKDFTLTFFFFFLTIFPQTPRGRHYRPCFAEERKIHTFIIRLLARLNEAKYVREKHCIGKFLKNSSLLLKRLAWDLMKPVLLLSCFVLKTTHFTEEEMGSKEWWALAGFESRSTSLPKRGALTSLSVSPLSFSAPYCSSPCFPRPPARPGWEVCWAGLQVPYN